MKRRSLVGTPLAIFIILSLINLSASALRLQQQDTSIAKSDTAEGLPLKPTRTIEFETTEGTWMSLDVSPDGKQLAVDTDDGKEASVWVYPLDGTAAMRRLTFGGANRNPFWTRDGQRIVFRSDREGDLGLFW